MCILFLRGSPDNIFAMGSAILKRGETVKVLIVKARPDGGAEYTVDLTKQEKDEIKAEKGWKRLTKQRIQKWFIETVDKIAD